MHENKDLILLVEGNQFAKMGRKEYHDQWASRIRRATVVPGLRSPPRNTALSYPLFDVEPIKDGLRTPKPQLATESVGSAAIPIMVDFLSCEKNLNFLDRILEDKSFSKAESAWSFKEE